MRNALLSVHGLKNELYYGYALGSAHGIKESGYFAYKSTYNQVMTFVLRCRFQWLTNRLTTFPFAPFIPMDERSPAVLKPNRSENSLSPLNEMQFTNGVPMKCQIILLVPMVPLVPIDKRNPTVLKPNRSENSLSPLKKMQFTNGVPMECPIILLVPIVPLVPMDERNPTVLKPN